MNRNLLLFSALLGMAALTGCSETADLIEVERVVPAVRTENFPTVPIKVDSTVVLRVYYQPSNGCGRFARVDSATTQASSSTRITTMTLYATYPEEGQDVVCTAQARENVYTINYKAVTPGKHVFRFWKSDSEFVSDTVEVKAR